MENDLYTFSFCRADWERIMASLRATAVTNYQEAHRVGADSTYSAVLFQEGGYFQALADDIEFILPD
jgi:hypothetical protein